MSMNKQHIRSEMRIQRSVLSAEEQKAASAGVLERLRGLEAYRSARTVMAYIAVRGELNLEPVIRDALSSGKRLVLPRCESIGVMSARYVTAWEQLVPGAYGISEPDVCCAQAEPEGIDLILVPGTAFDRRGGRLGQGGGYYDRFLKKTCGLRMGVCHGFALMDDVPMQAHDVRMDAVLTPDAVFYGDTTMAEMAR